MVTSKEPKLVFEFQKTSCYGSCPVYKASVYDNGLVKYEGIVHVKNIGKFDYKVDADFIKFVKSETERMDFVNLKDVYPSPGISDFPSTILTMYIGDMVKVVEQIGEAPQDLLDLNKAIHEEMCKISDCKVERYKTIEKE